jgi:RND superfamily putative drug exporter
LSIYGGLGVWVSRHWAAVVLAWIALAGGLELAHWRGWTPGWNDITLDGDLAHLPSDTTSLRGARLLAEAFPEDRAKSQIVLVIARSDERLAATDLQLAHSLARQLQELSGELPILDVWTPQTDVVGRKLVSRDRRAILIVAQLASELMAVENLSLLERVRQVVVQAQSQAPAGLEIGITGSAAIGGDMLSCAAESIRNTERFTILLVVLILLLVYRAPLLVVVPMLAIGASIVVATDLVAILVGLSRHIGPGDWGLKVFKTTKIFVVVLLYGAGTDFCLFLTARYKEELARGLSVPPAAAEALGRVGVALAASALTTIVGLATMAFADFGKFSSSGPVIAICLGVTLVSCLTLAPALLTGLGRAVFWPFGLPVTAPDRSEPSSGCPDHANLAIRTWDMLAKTVVTYPGRILVASLLVLLPLAWRGRSTEVTYDLLSELTGDRPSVRGTALLRAHFPPGETGPLTVLVSCREKCFTSNGGLQTIGLLTKQLYEMPGVDSVRSLAEPLGDLPGSLQPFTRAGLTKLAARSHPLTRARFVAQDSRYEERVARFELILAHDPFSPAAIESVDRIARYLDALKSTGESPWTGAQFELVGTTAGLRDLKRVTESDRRLIEQLVVIAVLAVLLMLLRRPLICLYLIFSVLLSYFATMGIAELAFRHLYGDTYQGLDWKVPLFLFVILVAVGEDYNIYLVTRVFEEQRTHGHLAGIRRALVQTGGIITSCGIIMAGTFLSMMTGSLRGMSELGFALTLGIVLDTFFVRPVLVPSFLALLARRAEHARPAAADPSHGGPAADHAHPGAPAVPIGRGDSSSQATALPAEGLDLPADYSLRAYMSGTQESRSEKNRPWSADGIFSQPD